MNIVVVGSTNLVDSTKPKLLLTNANDKKDRTIDRSLIRRSFVRSFVRCDCDLLECGVVPAERIGDAQHASHRHRHRAPQHLIERSMVTMVTTTRHGHVRCDNCYFALIRCRYCVRIVLQKARGVSDSPQ